MTHRENWIMHLHTYTGLAYSVDPYQCEALLWLPNPKQVNILIIFVSFLWVISKYVIPIISSWPFAYFFFCLELSLQWLFDTILKVLITKSWDVKWVLCKIIQWGFVQRQHGRYAETADKRLFSTLQPSGPPKRLETWGYLKETALLSAVISPIGYNSWMSSHFR